MIKIPVTYTNFDGEEVKQDLYFHMSMRELTEMELSVEGGMYDHLQKILKSNNGGQILGMFQDMVQKAYGEREDNNPNSFLKDPKRAEQFMNSLAYDALFSHLVSDPAAMIDFINGLIPEQLAKSPEVAAAKASIKAGETVQLPAKDEEPGLMTDDELAEKSGLAHPKDAKGEIVPWAFREPTNAELTRMNRQQMLECMQRKSNGWKPAE